MARWEYAQIDVDKKGEPVYGVRRVTETGHAIPIPPAALTTYEYVSKAEYVGSYKIICW